MPQIQPYPKIKKNQITTEQQLLKLERAYHELEAKFALQNKQLIKAFKDIEQLKKFCNWFHRLNKTNKNITGIPDLQYFNKDSRGNNTTKE